MRVLGRRGRVGRRTWALALASMGVASAALILTGGAANYFLKVDGIEGEVTERAHAKQIQVLDYSWGEGQAGAVPSPRRRRRGDGTDA